MHMVKCISQDRIDYAVRTNTYTLKCEGLNQAKVCLLPISHTHLYWKDLFVDFINCDLRALLSWDADIFKTHEPCSLNGRGRENKNKEHKLLIASGWKSHKWPLLPVHWPELSLIEGRLENAVFLMPRKKETRHKSLSLPQKAWALDPNSWEIDCHVTLGKLPYLSSP